MAADPDPQQTILPSADFVRRLRQRAEAAAEAAVHHAELSERYHELSRRLSRLAEQAGSTDVDALRQTLAELDATTPSVTALDANRKNLPAVEVRDRSDAGAATANAATQIRFDGAVADDPLSLSSQASAGRSPAGEAVRSGRLRTRRLVERFRSARLAVRRIRIRARKSDLQPKPRTAADELKQGKGSILTSGLLVAVAVTALSLVRWQVEAEPPLDPIICSFAEERADEPDPLPVETPVEEQGKQTETEVADPPPEPPEDAETPPVEQPEESQPQPEPMAVPEPPPESANMADVEPVESATEMEDAAETNDVKSTTATADHRSAAGRAVLLQKYGGSAASESAVQRGLEWLISVQHPQGYWDFNNVGPAGAAGTVHNPIGGTAYALLPFLAAGQTHRDGRYKKQIAAGLTYLSRIGVQAPAGYDLRGMINKQSDDKEPNEAYYVHGAATLVLCEAYGMTKDRRLKSAAEGAVRFIVNSQDPRGGGWRYNPHQPGSTSVTVIQVMALQAARKAGLQVPDSVWQGVRHYLNSVQVDGAGRYGYEVQKKRYTGAVTAMALLCRMYLGWGRDDGDMQAGIRLLDKAGPYDNLYSLYFATQVMKNWGGVEWERWNQRLRDDLIAAQETAGAAAGSWKPRTGAIHAKQGGRLLTTSLATLTLQVYYRYQPLLPEPAAVATDK